MRYAAYSSIAVIPFRTSNPRQQLVRACYTFVVWDICYEMYCILQLHVTPISLSVVSVCSKRKDFKSLAGIPIDQGASGSVTPEPERVGGCWWC